MKHECSIVRDLLPLYAEDMVSPDTKAFLKEHLSVCEPCRREFSQMQQPEAVSFPMPVTGEAVPLQILNRKWKRKNFAIALLLLLSAVLIGGYLLILCHRPFEVAVPSRSEDILVTTWIEPWEEACGNQRFRIHFEHRNGKALQLSREDTYATDASGHHIPTGYTIEVRETLWDLFGSAEYQHSLGMAYACEEETLPEGFDFTITVIYKDKTVTYSMASEGLFTAQN